MTAFTLALLQDPTQQPMWFVRVVAFFQANALGVFMVLLSALTLALLVQWIAWVSGLGRFKDQRSTAGSNSLRFLFSDALVKIIDDFRHLLALIVVGIFAGAIVWALAVAGGSSDELTKSLQAVVSTLGGLVGSIIGYYFGESRARTDGGDGGQGVPVGEQGDPAGGGQLAPAPAAAEAGAAGAASGPEAGAIRVAPQPPVPESAPDLGDGAGEG